MMFKATVAAITLVTSVCANAGFSTDRAECAQVATRVANMYSILKTGDIDLAMQVREQIIANIRTLQAGERYQTAIVTAAERYQTMSETALQQFLVFECTH